MFCPQCGAANADNIAQCTQCGTALQPLQAYVPPPPAPSSPGVVPQQPYTGEPIPNYLWQSIVCTVLGLMCCLSLPFGIVAIVFSTQVNSKLAYGDIAGAKDSSNKAKIFCWVSIGIFGVIGIVYMLFLILGLAGSLIPNTH
jgi:interferon-induced transmembrane protein/zinc ribbon protein